MHTRLFILLITGLLLHFKCYSQKTLHAIIVVKTQDRYAELGFDPKPAWRISMKKIEDELNRVEDFTNLKVKRYYFTRSNFNKKKLVDSIQQLKVNPDDAIWFYYAGHGYGDADCNYPNLVVSRKEDANGNTLYKISTDPDISLSTCYLQEMLQQKNPRLLISLYETCNYYSKEEVVEGGFLVDDIIKENYKVLFEDTKGHVFITASKKGQYAGWNTKIGGYFTHWFLNQLHYRLRQPKVKSCDWFEIGLNTITKLKVYTKNHPDFDKPQILYGEVKILDEKGDELNCKKSKKHKS